MFETLSYGKLKLVIPCRILCVCKIMTALMDVVFTFSDTRVVGEECFVFIVPIFVCIIFQLVARNISVQ
jgi:hypothetical protein